MSKDNLIEGRKKAYLSREIKYNGKIMTNKEWLDALIKEGKKPIIKEVLDTAKKNQILNDWEHIKNIYPLGNTSHPQTIEAMRLKKIIDNDDFPKKNEYRAMGEDGSFSVLEKFGYEYMLDDLSKKENVDDSDLDEYKKDKENLNEFTKLSKGKDWEITDNVSDYVFNYFNSITKDDHPLILPISIDEKGDFNVAVGFINNEFIIIGDRDNSKIKSGNKVFKTINEAITELDELSEINKIPDENTPVVKKEIKNKINSYSVKNWSEIPTIWKNTKEVKKVKYTNSPFDKDLVNMLEPIASDDSLRPIMNGVNFDDYGITATNAHILINIPNPNEKFKGTYATIPKRSYSLDANSDAKIKDNLFISPKYPPYENVIPKSKDATRVQKVNVYKILQWTEVALNYCNKGSFNVLYWFGDTSISFNAKFMIESMKLLLKLGYSEVYCFSTEPNRAIVFSPDKEYKLGKSLILLLMPVIKNAADEIKGGSFDLDFSRELLAYYDFSTDEIRNSNDSVAEFKMNYGDYDVLPENEIKMLNKFSEKNTVPILDFFAVRDGKIHASNFDTSLLIKQTDLENGLYDVLDGAIEFNQHMDSDEYPIGFEVGEPKIKFIIGSDVLNYYSHKLIGFLNKDKFRPETTGILFEYKEHKMYMVATNYHIMAKIDITKYIEINEGQEDFRFILSTNNLIKFLDNIDESALTVSASNKHVSFENKNYVFNSKLIDGKYPNFEGVIESFKNKKINLSKSELLNCLKSDAAQKFIKKYKKEDLAIFDDGEENGRLKIFIGKRSSYVRDTPTVIDEKELIGTVGYSIEDGDFQINDSLVLIMPIFLANVNFFVFDSKYIATILDSLNCDDFSFYFNEPKKPYIVKGSCLNYGTEVKSSSSYKEVVKVSKNEKEIEELESLIELLKEVLAENPKDEESKDAIELYEETLAELKKNNSEKFAKGGDVGCGCQHSFEKGGKLEDKYGYLNSYTTGSYLTMYKTDLPDGTLVGFDSDFGKVYAYQGDVVDADKLPKNVKIKKLEKGGVIESNDSKYFSKTFESKGNTWSILFVWGKINYVSIRKETNNPFKSGVGKEFKNVDEAIAYYKNPEMKVQLIFAENEAKELGYVPKFEDGGSIESSDIETARNWWGNTLSLNKQKELLIKYAPEYSLDYIRAYPETAFTYLSRNIYSDGYKTILDIWKKEGSPTKSDYLKKMYGIDDLTDKELTSKIFQKAREKNEGYLENGGELDFSFGSSKKKDFIVEDSGDLKVIDISKGMYKGVYVYNKKTNKLDSDNGEREDVKHYLIKKGIIKYENGGGINSYNKEYEKELLLKYQKEGKELPRLTKVATEAEIKFLHGKSKNKPMQKGDIIYFTEPNYNNKLRGEVLDVLEDSNYLVSRRGIKTVVVNEENIIGLAPKKESDLFNTGVSIYDERVNDINLTVFYKTYGIGENPFEVNYDESNEYGYGIYFLDEKYSGIGKYKESRILAIKPNVKKPLIFLNDDGSSFNSQYKEAYDNAVAHDGVNSKDDFNKKMIELGYDSMFISDIHGMHLILFYNDPNLYSVKSDKGYNLT